MTLDIGEMRYQLQKHLTLAVLTNSKTYHASLCCKRSEESYNILDSKLSCISSRKYATTADVANHIDKQTGFVHDRILKMKLQNRILNIKPNTTAKQNPTR